MRTLTLALCTLLLAACTTGKPVSTCDRQCATTLTQPDVGMRQ